MKNKLLILGCGYSAQYIARRLIVKGWEVIGTTRSIKNFRKLEELEIQPVAWDDKSALNSFISSECSVLSSVPPKGLVDHGLNKFEELIQQDSSKINWIGYLSSTGVYGERNGGWVTEQSKLDTLTEQGQARITAEKNWLKLAGKHKTPLFVFRIAGIYGPDRNIFDRIKTGNVQKVIKTNQYFNRVHVEDIAGVVGISVTKPLLAGVYNVSDDLPSSAADLIDEASRILEIPFFPEIDFKDANLSAMGKSFYSESKRVSNKKLVEELGYSFKYPTYFTGLRSLINRG